MALTEPGYRPRLVDSRIARYMSLFGALSIEGPKWCGKTWTALNHANSAVYILDPENNYSTREAARLNPAAILTGKNRFLSMSGRGFQEYGMQFGSPQTGRTKKAYTY